LLEQIIPQLFANKPRWRVVRVWVAGCSTGEEAYSIAILLQEQMEALKQVRGTGLCHRHRRPGDRHRARWPVSGEHRRRRVAERLARFFTRGTGWQCYRINKSIRDLLVFSEQDVIKDPPFSRLDLISCRNLLIYLGAGVAEKVIPLFHYALNPGGVCSSAPRKASASFTDLFAVLDRKAKLYQRKEDLGCRACWAWAALCRPRLRDRCGATAAHGKTAFPGKLPLRELTEQAMLQQNSPRPARWSTPRATSFTCTGAAACTWSRRPARRASTTSSKWPAKGCATN
jgi:two-component system CheB/CheR fusion protein